MSAGDRSNFSGDLSLTAPTGGVTRGSLYLISGVYVMARETASAGDSFLAAVTGPVEVTKATGTGKSFVAGEEAFFLANVINKTATGATLVGFVLEAAGVSDTTVKVYLTGLPVTAS